MNVRIVRDEDPDPRDLERLREAIDSFNVHRTGRDDWGRITVFARDDDGRVVGGITGDWWAGWLHVTYLWLDEEIRGRGLGRELLAEAERAAIAKACRGVLLETYSFQAPGFYRKLGYREIGRLDGYPPGHSQYYFWKPLGELG